MSAILKIFLFISLVKNSVASTSDLLVQTALGSLSGFYLNASYGRTYRAFEGIPYAKPPLDDLRFEPPQRYGPWKSVLTARQPASKCLQNMPPMPANPNGGMEGAEDCLYLNIYTPLQNQNRTDLLPVIFWIHGGGFHFGNGHMEGSSYIMNRDVVYVNLNYRLGILGFMSTEDDIVPGNMGLKDQSMALRWVHENIISFGGDPDRITIAGGSAGGASVHYHMLSPMSRGLFQGAISISGTALKPWAQAKNSAERSRSVASLLGCTTNTTKLMLECLKSQPASNIMQLTRKFQPWEFNPLREFGPVVEKNSAEPFIDQSPVDIMVSGNVADVPWLITVTSEEGLVPVAEFVENERLMTQLDAHWETIAPNLLDFNFTILKAKHVLVSETIRSHYLGNDKIERKNALPLIRMISDRLYLGPAQKSAKLMAAANRSPVWFSSYNYRAPFSLTQVFGATGSYGVSHGDDAMLILSYPGLPAITYKPMLDMQSVLLNIIESFMKNGIPATNSAWPKVNPLTESLDYLQMSGPQELVAVSNSNFADRKFWSSIDFQENVITNPSVI